MRYSAMDFAVHGTANTRKSPRTRLYVIQGVGGS
jgi:hypothetical protein